MLDVRRSTFVFVPEDALGMPDARPTMVRGESGMIAGH